MELAGKPASLSILVAAPAAPVHIGMSSVFSREAVSLAAVSLWQHAVVDRAHVASIDIEQRAAEIEEDRPGRLPQGRVLPDGRYEIANGALTLFAHELIAAQGGPDQIMIEVAPLTDVEMFRIAHREGRADTSVLAYDRARSIQAALDLFGGTQKQIAETLGLDEATVTNSLHILKVEKQMGPVLSDPWRITENQAKRFQKLWSDPARRPLVRKAVKELEVGTARAHMSALFKAFPTGSKNETPIVNAANVQIGTIRRSTAGITIKLEKLADAVPADDLGAILAAAIGASHR